MNNEEAIRFGYCGKVDIHALDLKSPLDLVVAIASEHGFRGVVVSAGKLEEVVKHINSPIHGDKNIIPIAVIDYPYGSSTTDVRRYSILSAKEKGAKEVEVVAPYGLFVSKSFKEINDDISNLSAAAKEANIKLRYVIDQTCVFADETIKTKICRMLSQNRIEQVSTSLGFYDSKIDHSDLVLKMRSLKSKTGCQTKAFITTDNVNDISLYAKAGADSIGLEWKTAPNLIHAYEEIVNKKV